jgi:hypothetical protein
MLACFANGEKFFKSGAGEKSKRINDLPCVESKFSLKSSNFGRSLRVVRTGPFEIIRKRAYELLGVFSRWFGGGARKVALDDGIAVALLVKSDIEILS